MSVRAARIFVTLMVLTVVNYWVMAAVVEGDVIASVAVGGAAGYWFRRCVALDTTCEQKPKPRRKRRR